ncbi:ArsR/SmtB family transcription factor [Sinomonas albida]|uniref:ArsR/SmtB family transcription factor n=1 Tax=Sinomonas albida TaxID=369942 RepID=UPI001F46C7A3|nr:metalloregulator ArsR/SmtB family transcription factor [Sinomonas albida]
MTTYRGPSDGQARDVRSEDVWDAMGDRTRRAILERLAEHPCPVGELAAQLPVSRPAVSQHLKVLKETGLVSDETVGTRRIYRLNPAGVEALRDQLDMFWNRALANYGAAVREDAGSRDDQGHEPGIEPEIQSEKHTEKKKEKEKK